MPKKTEFPSPLRDEDEHVFQVVVRQVVTGAVSYAKFNRDKMHAKEFMREVHKKKRGDYQKILAACVLLAREGNLTNKQKFRHERNKIWALKPTSQIRIPCFREGDTWFITHGFYKKSNKWKKEELDKADKIRDYHIENHLEEKKGK